MQISLPLLLCDELERLLFHPATAATAFDAALSLSAAAAPIVNPSLQKKQQCASFLSPSLKVALS